jgi:secondary thiamine-phosphate synthase enzyme
MAIRLDAVHSAAPQIVASARLLIGTAGEGLVEITREVARFLAQVDAGDGVMLAYLRHTSASLTAALRRLAPEDAGWVHEVEGPDDMPAHVKAMLTGISLHVPVIGGALALGTWQGIYLVEHRARAHEREAILQFVGSRKGSE